MSDSDRLFGYVERFFAQSKQTEFPTVRRACRSLRWNRTRLVEAIEGDRDGRLFTTEYFTSPSQPFGDHFVESYGESGGLAARHMERTTPMDMRTRRCQCWNDD